MNDKLKLILHMGSPKTGTTSLQAGLHAIRPQLAEAGIFYPVSQWERTGAHHILTAIFDCWDAVRPELHRRFETHEEARQAAVDFISSLKRDAKDSGCHTIVLSSELVFPSKDRNAIELKSALRDLDADILPVVYVREPADLYRSRMQQRAKTGEFYRPHRLRPYKSQIEEIEQVFGVRPIVRPYDRDQLIDGDILVDFCKAVLGLDLAQEHMPKLSQNVSLSAEATLLLIAYAQHVKQVSGHVDGSAAAIRHRAVIRKFVDSENRLTKLELKPELKAKLRSSAIEYEWLREKYGIEFRQIDYENLSDDPERVSEYNSPLDIFDVDSNALAWLSAAIIHELGEPKPRNPEKRRNAVADNVSRRPKRLDISTLFGRK